MSDSHDTERAPILGSWARVYALTLGLLVFWIVAFSWFTFVYRPSA